MKKLVVLFVILVAIATTVFGQITSSDLLEKRTQEIQAIDKSLRKSATRGTQVDPDEREKLVAKVDSFYQPLILAAMGRESSASTTTSATPTTSSVQKKAGSHITYGSDGKVTGTTEVSSETPVAPPNPIPAPADRNCFGSTVTYQGDQGAFSGNSTSVRRGSEAYATVAIADANAYLVRQMAKGASATVNAPATGNQVGLEGMIINKYRFRELEVEIVGTNPGNVYKRTFLLGKEQSITDYLLPGNYRATIKIVGHGSPAIHNFTVAPQRTHSFHGKNVFWGLYGGSSW